MTTQSARLRIAGRIASFAVVTIAVVVAIKAVSWPRVLEALAHGNPVWLVAGVAANASILFCWAAFWLAVRPATEPPVAFSRMLEIVSVSSALMNTLPFGGGHASSILLLIRRGGLTKRGALSVMALDQLGEGVVKLALFLLVALLVPLPDWMRVVVTAVSLGVAVWFVTLAIASRWVGELAILHDWRRALAALVCVGTMKGVQLLAMVSVQLAYDVHLTVGGSLLAFASVLIASLLPATPGNVGTYEAGAFLAYRYLGVPAEQALSLGIMQHLCFMLPSVGVGYLVLSARTLSRRAVAPR